MADLEGFALQVGGQLTPFERMRVGGRGIRGPRHLGPKLIADMQPDAALMRAGGLAEQLRHPGEDIIHRIRTAEAVGELRHHLVRR